MKILVLTNLYPPQELGGYGRCMSDFTWGLIRLGHIVDVLTSDAKYLGTSSVKGPSNERVERKLMLKGTYEGGIKLISDECLLNKIDEINSTLITEIWKERGGYDGVILGNMDLVGLRVVETMSIKNVPILHHIGFVGTPFSIEELPKSNKYQLVAASEAVSKSLKEADLSEKGKSLPVVFPGVRSDLFGNTTKRELPAPLNGKDKLKPLGDKGNPLRVCFAGLMMSSKGAHTMVEAIIKLKRQQIYIEGCIAGGSFQAGYRESLENIIQKNQIENIIFTGQLTRDCLARCMRLHHVCVFPSIHPEAFGIVGAEAMASGLVLVSSGVGGAKELVIEGKTGYLFEPGNANDLAERLRWLCNNPKEMRSVSKEGLKHARNELDVQQSARKLEKLLLERQGD